MKRLTYKRRRWFETRQRRSLRARLRRKQRERTIEMIRPLSGSWRARPPPTSLNVKMPSVLCFNRNCAETLQVLRRIRERLSLPMRGARIGCTASKHRGARIHQGIPYFRFEDMRSISLSATIVLAAEFERSSRLAGGILPILVNVDAWDSGVLGSLWDIGFFDIVGFPTGIGKPDLDLNSVLLPMRSGETADSQAVSQLVEDLRRLYPGTQGAPERLLYLYGAMVEAVVNVCSHAYLLGAVYRFRPVMRWWMTGAVDRKAGWTTAVIYDQGVTIPVTLPNWPRYASWAKRCLLALGLVPSVDDPRSDGAAIAIALEEAVSSTGELHRGQGLAQMREFVDGCRDGYLRIMSRCGEVIYRPNGSPEIKNYETSLDGTLIEWSVLI
jgi:hypothetical protein